MSPIPKTPQADHERDRAGASSGVSAADFDADDYRGPAIL